MDPFYDLLLSGNNDDPRVTGLCQLLATPTRLDDLVQQLCGDAPVQRSALLVAHAGDGKSHLLARLAAAWTQRGRPLHRFPEDGHGLALPGLHVLNDPSPLPRDLVASFLGEAFSGAVGGERVMVASANRGLLRELIPLVRDPGASEWLLRALTNDESALRPGTDQRIAVPLDLRTLVPGPGDRAALERSPTHRFALRIFEEARQRGLLGETAEPGVWADRVAVALAVCEATGHHVTFREVGCLTACVGQAILGGGSDSGLAALFADGEPPQALHLLRRALRRMDPARVATPGIDALHPTRMRRDADVRARALDGIVALFTGHGPSFEARLPFSHAVDFLRLCRQVGDANQAAVDVRVALARLQCESACASAPKAIADARAVLKSTTVGGEGLGSVPLLFRGLARIAWGAAGEHDQGTWRVIPLASPLQPGSSLGAERWTVLRAAIGLENARFVVPTTDPGPFVERGLVLPAFQISGPQGLPASPSLPLDLELFERLCAAGGDRPGPTDLGDRSAQISAWLDGMVAGWEQAWSEQRSVFVAFQTLVRGDGTLRRSEPLRPPLTGLPLTEEQPPLKEPDSALNILKKLWPERSGGGARSVAVTPSGCASALLLWAGCPAHPPTLPAREWEDDSLREALGCGTASRVRGRTNLVSPAFPWSAHTLGIGMVARQVVECATPLLELGAALASALGAGGADVKEWRAALRGAWAADERVLDGHPSSLLAHQWLGVGAAGIQAAHWLGARPPGSAHEVLHLLLQPEVPFGRTQRWWLLGTWAAWRLILAALTELHGRDELPLVLPKAGPDEGEYRRVLAGWFLADGAEPIAAAAQSLGVLVPANARKNFDLVLDSRGAFADVLRLVCWRAASAAARPTDCTLGLLEEELSRAGVFALRRSPDVRRRLPPGAIAGEHPASPLRYAAVLREALAGLGLIENASDGASLFRSPWSKP